MHVLLLGVNHATAPIAVRERFALSEVQLTEQLRQLQQTKSVLECVIVSTCNRTEWYVVVDKPERGFDHVRRFICKHAAVSTEEFASYSSHMQGEAVARHLFRVTCGLDSMLVGETQILGQVRDQFLLAQQLGTTGALFNTLFKEAITAARRAHAETGISEHPVSVGYAAVELARKMFGSFRHCRIVMIGAGKMADLTVKYLREHGVGAISIVNRTLAHARALAESCGGQAHTMEQLPDLLVDADIVISSTGASAYILTKIEVERAMSRRRNKLLFMIDIALPRDLEPDIHTIENVFLYDLDDLRGVVQYNLEQRQKLVAKVESLIAEGVGRYEYWLKLLGVTPLIKALQDKAAAIHAETIADLNNKLPDLTERERRLIHKLSKSMLNQLMRDPILKVKELSARADGDEAREWFGELFGLTELPANDGVTASEKVAESATHAQDKPVAPIAGAMTVSVPFSSTKG